MYSYIYIYSYPKTSSKTLLSGVPAGKLTWGIVTERATINTANLAHT